MAVYRAAEHFKEGDFSSAVPHWWQLDISPLHQGHSSRIHFQSFRRISLALLRLGNGFFFLPCVWGCGRSSAFHATRAVFALHSLPSSEGENFYRITLSFYQNNITTNGYW
jgi:hypothetical protein